MRGLLRFSQIEVMGVNNPQDFRERIETGKILPPTVIVFKYRAIPTKNEEAKQEEQEYRDCLNAWVSIAMIWFHI